jgi:hypothetical protein
MKIQLEENDIKNLDVFLGRVQLNGAEVGAFNQLVNKLHTPIKEEPKAKVVEVKK